MKFWIPFWMTSFKICGRWSGIGKYFYMSFLSIFFHIIVSSLLHTCLSPLLGVCNSHNQSAQDIIICWSLNLGIYLCHWHLAGHRMRKLIPVFKVCCKTVMSHSLSIRRLDYCGIIWHHTCSLHSFKLLKKVYFNIMKI